LKEYIPYRPPITNVAKIRQFWKYKIEGKKEKYKDSIWKLYLLFIWRRANIYVPVCSQTVTRSPNKIHEKYHSIATPKARLVQKITKKTTNFRELWD
jgi:hypothetical protein